MENTDFIYCKKAEGISIGCGDRYGLYIKHDLLNGTSHPSQTFNNQVLSKKNEFDINFIEVKFN